MITIPLRVARGPFAGLRYAVAESVCSALVPKLLGCYEQEIAGLVEKLCLIPYTDIVDVGCAEGYYANGFAIRHPQAIVYAFDIDPHAQNLCRRTAEVNGVADRVRVQESCTPEVLLRLPYRGRSLIFSDCEGGELELFTDEVVAALDKHDFVIETHDFLRVDLSTLVEAVFVRHGYHVTRIKSIDDLEKARTYDIPELRGMQPLEKFHALAEHRPRIMEWLYCVRHVAEGLPT